MINAPWLFNLSLALMKRQDFIFHHYYSTYNIFKSSLIEIIFQKIQEKQEKATIYYYSKKGKG